MSSTRLPNGSFLARALAEARRHGQDRFVFVRELLQNARDAGARNVDFEVSQRPGHSQVVCRDDGEGMSLEHARRFLFALYASSKDGRSRAAGRFGVGFWSVLRFVPDRIVVRSWPRGARSWELSLDGRLTQARAATPGRRPTSGTEILLEASRDEPGLTSEVRQALERNAREVRQRDRPRRLLSVRVNGRGANARLALPAPSSSFRQGRLRGVVALGTKPRVEVFSKGLRMRHAAYLQDLLASDPDHEHPAGAELADGLAPQALLEGERLEPLLSRADLRESRDLLRLVKLARREMERLVERQLELARPRPWWRRIADSRLGVAGLALLLALVSFLALASATRRDTRDRPSRPAGTAPAAAVGHLGPYPYADLRQGYEGPRVGPLGPERSAVALRYRPAEQAPRFSALVVEYLDPHAAPLRAEAPRPARPTAPCSSDCLHVELEVADGPGPLRLPVPTGHEIDSSSVRLAGQAAPLLLSGLGEPMLELGEAYQGVLTYTTGPGPIRAPRLTQLPQDLPPELLQEATRLAGRPLAARVRGAVTFTRQRLQGSVAPEIVDRHEAARHEGTPLLERTLAIGAGDCDVINGVLLAILRAAGVRARLVVGYLGQEGKAAPWLHAWVEYRGDAAAEGWQIADASVSDIAAPHVAGEPAPLQPPAPTASPTEGLPPRRRPSWAPGLTIGLVLLLALLVAAYLRPRRSLQLQADHDVSRLLGGALAQPDAYKDIPQVFERRLVPLADGSSASLLHCWHLAARSRLYRAGRSGHLVTQAQSLRACVVDTASPEGARVADALGAMDLDTWQQLLDASRSHPLLERAARQLRHRQGSVEVRMLPGRASAAVLELPAPTPSLGRGPGLFVVLGERTAWLEELTARSRTHPREALFDAADRLLELLDAPQPRRAAVLGPLARQLLESLP